MTLLCYATAARADNPGAAEDAEWFIGAGSEAGHAWLVLPLPDELAGQEGKPSANAEDDDVCVILHAPPRASGGLPGAAAGGLRLSRRLAEEPVAVAAVDATLYMLFRDESNPDAAALRIRALTAVDTGVPGIWYDEPQARLDAVQPFEKDARLTGIASDGRRLIGIGVDPSGSPVMYALERGAWVRLAPGAADGPVTGMTATRPLRVRDADLKIADTGYWLSRHAAGDGSSLRIDASIRGSEGARRLLADVPGVPSSGPLAVAVVGGARPSVMAAWIEPPGESPAGGYVPPGPPRVRYRVAEVSVDTGRVWYIGPAQSTTGVATNDLRLMAAAMVVLMAASILVLVRPAPDAGVVALGPGYAFAGPGRRLFAAVLDLSVMMLAASFLIGVPIRDALSIGLVLAETRGWMLIPSTLILGLVYSVACETLFGRTLGKVACGCWVLRVEAVAGGPASGEGQRRYLSPAAALVRNAVKWVLSPIAALMLVDGTGRHRGDALARAVVVVVLPHEEGGPGA